MKVQVTFTVNVDWCDEDLGPVKKGDPMRGQIERCVAEAVHNAMLYAQGEGHTHEMENEISIELIPLDEGGRVQTKML